MRGPGIRRVGRRRHGLAGPNAKRVGCMDFPTPLPSKETSARLGNPNAKRVGGMSFPTPLWSKDILLPLVSHPFGCTAVVEAVSAGTWAAVIVGDVGVGGGALLGLE